MMTGGVEEVEGILELSHQGAPGNNNLVLAVEFDVILNPYLCYMSTLKSPESLSLALDPHLIFRQRKTHFYD